MTKERIIFSKKNTYYLYLEKSDLSKIFKLFLASLSGIGFIIYRFQINSRTIIISILILIIMLFIIYFSFFKKEPKVTMTEI